MERAPFYIEGCHLRFAVPDPLRIGPFVEFAAHGQSGRRCLGRDWFHQGQGASERLTTPVLSDMVDRNNVKETLQFERDCLGLRYRM